MGVGVRVCVCGGGGMENWGGDGRCGMGPVEHVIQRNRACRDALFQPRQRAKLSG